MRQEIIPHLSSSLIVFQSLHIEHWGLWKAAPGNFLCTLLHSMCWQHSLWHFSCQTPVKILPSKPLFTATSPLSKTTFWYSVSMDVGSLGDITDFTKPHSRERVRQGRPFCGELQLGGQQKSFPTPAVFQPNFPAVNTSYRYKTKPLVSQNILLHSNGVGKHLLLWSRKEVSFCLTTVFCTDACLWPQPSLVQSLGISSVLSGLPWQL